MSFVEEDVDADAEREIQQAINQGAPHAIVWGEILGHYTDIFELQRLPNPRAGVSGQWELYPLFSTLLLEGWGVALVGVKAQRVRLLCVRTAEGTGFSLSADVYQQALGDAVARATKYA